MDPYDALHAFYLITTIHSKRRTALQSGKPFDTKCSVRFKPCTKDFPACGPSGVGNLADVSYDPQKIDANVTAFHFGSFASQRRLLAAAMDEGIDTFATEQQIRHFTHPSTKGPGVYSAPQPMGPTEVAHLTYAIVNDPESEFSKNGLIHEPVDMFTIPGSRDIEITQAISIGEPI